MKKTTKSFAGQMIRVCLFGIVMPLVAIELWHPAYSASDAISSERNIWGAQYTLVQPSISLSA